MVEHATTCPIAQGTGTDCRCRVMMDAHQGYAAAAPLPAGRELDAAVAERVMGWRRERKTVRWYRPDRDGAWSLAPFSTDMAAAWSVVERVQKLHPGWRFDLLGGDESWGYRKTKPLDAGGFVVDKSVRTAFGWRASFFGDEDPTENYGQRHADEWAEAPALAICRAALAAVDAPRRALGGGV